MMKTVTIIWVLLVAASMIQVSLWMIACSNTKEGHGFLKSVGNPFNLLDPLMFTDVGNNYRIKSLYMLGVVTILFVTFAVVAS